MTAEQVDSDQLAVVPLPGRGRPLEQGRGLLLGDQRLSAGQVGTLGSAAAQGELQVVAHRTVWNLRMVGQGARRARPRRVASYQAASSGTQA